MLDAAITDHRGHIRLADGTQVRGVEVIPALLPYKITALDWAIIRQTVAELDIEDQCRYHPGDFVLEDGAYNPYRDSIDCSKLSGYQAPLLKVIQGRVQDSHPEFRTVSLEKISGTLRKFGMRIPTSRPSSRSRRARAKN